MNKKTQKKYLQLVLLQNKNQNQSAIKEIHKKVIEKLQHEAERELRVLLYSCQPYWVIEQLNKQQRKEIVDYYVQKILYEEEVDIYIPYRSVNGNKNFINCYYLVQKNSKIYKNLKCFLEQCNSEVKGEIITIEKINRSQIYIEFQDKISQQFEANIGAKFDYKFMEKFRRLYRLLIQQEDVYIDQEKKVKEKLKSYTQELNKLVESNINKRIQKGDVKDESLRQDLEEKMNQMLQKFANQSLQ